MTEFGISVEELQRLARLVEENGLSELRYEEGDLRVTLRTSTYRAAFTAGAVVGVPQPAVFAESAPSFELSSSAVSRPVGGADGVAADLLRIEAPIMGVFYRSSTPGDPAFVEIGDTVEVGQVVGVIEAMKVFSEVPSEFAGRVQDIPAKNGGLVQPGDPLVVLEAV